MGFVDACNSARELEADPEGVAAKIAANHNN